MIEPLGKRVIIKRDPAKTEAGTGVNGLAIVIPEAAQKPELSGTVLATGPAVEDVKVGDRVIFGKLDGQDINSKYTGEENCIILNEEQIKGIYV